MTNLIFYFWLILLIIYILSPLDAHPLFFDDLIAAGALFYLWYRHAKQKKQKGYSYTYSQPHGDKKDKHDGLLGLEEAHRVLGVNPDASWKEINKAYKGKIAKSHPDKVNHLSEELQEKAKELTLKLNNALDIIRRNKRA